MCCCQITEPLLPVHINHQYLHCVIMFEWCKMQPSLIIILFVRVVYQLHISVRCEISRLSAMWGTLQWFYAKWRRANQSRAPGTGTGQMVQTRWVNCSEDMVFIVLREICVLWIETSTFILLLHSVIESLEHKWFDLKPKHTCCVNTQVHLRRFLLCLVR